MNTKLSDFKARNRKRNAHLYENGLQEGYDFVVCPISGERMSMIKRNYIERILGLSEEQYPAVQRICNKRKENIKKGLAEIDPVTSTTKYELSQIKSRKILAEVDCNGESGYKRKGQKTRATHMSKIDELGRNGYSQIATKAIIKGNRTKADRGLISTNRNEFMRYKVIVQYLTEKYRNELSEGVITGLAGKEGAHHIDHKFSILNGYKQKVSPFVIGHLCNLQMLPWKINLSKHSACSIPLDELLKDCKYTQSQSVTEFNSVISLIRADLENNTPPNAAFLIERLYATNIC